MLSIKHLTKDYILKNAEDVHAIRDISLDFRRNEFVAILGPSGCVKTTFLNIIGGLDRYTTGDLYIRGESTKKYKDKDWDTYRNHSIGFIFQSYNLIPHQTVLQNVELALTISGINKKERRERAREVLRQVGLEKYERNKPNQMSGGQMQRVAIARALINDPEILLADEPTGALDSKTSIQIMELLKEVAKDRLVIMVTHNPDLADKYATRIVNMFDGQIVGDTNPYHQSPKLNFDKANKKGKKQSSMRFFTAFGLSLSNLISKFRRTLLVAIAGSIGIIGVSSVLAVSNGIKKYIASMQDDMLSSYPIGISEESVDYTSLMTGLQTLEENEDFDYDLSRYIGLDSMINYLMSKYKDFTSVKTNDINHNLLSYIENAPEGAVAAKKYNYNIDVTNNIFTTFKKSDSEDAKMMSLNGMTQMYISTLKTVDGFSDYAQFVDLFTSFMKQLPDNKEYIMGDGTNGQYKLIAGTYPESANDIVLVVDSDRQTVTDILLAQLGLYPQDEFLNIAKKSIAENDPEHEDHDLTEEELNAKYPYRSLFSFDEILNKEFVYYPHDALYEYSEIEAASYRSISASFVIMSGFMPTGFGMLNYDFDNDNYTGYVLAGSAGGYNLETLNLARVDGSSYDEEYPQYGVFEGVYSGERKHLEIRKGSFADSLVDVTDPENEKV